MTDQRRMEAELRSFADVVAHDLREPVSGITHLVALLERRAGEPPSSDVLRLLRASAERAGELIDGVLAYARAGELRRERVTLDQLWPRSRRTCARGWRRPARPSRSASCPRSTATRASCAGSSRTSSATR